MIEKHPRWDFLRLVPKQERRLPQTCRSQQTPYCSRASVYEKLEIDPPLLLPDSTLSRYFENGAIRYEELPIWYSDEFIRRLLTLLHFQSGPFDKNRIWNTLPGFLHNGWSDANTLQIVSSTFVRCENLYYNIVSESIEPIMLQVTCGKSSCTAS